MTPVKIAIGSKNKAKISAVEQAFLKCKYTIDIQAIDAVSGVSEMPFSDFETMTGALNRAKDCIEKSEAQLAIGLEGGVMETPYGLFLCNWGALVEHTGEIYFASGARIKLPEEIAVELNKGRELADVMDEYCNRQDIRSHEGAIGIFTNGYINRASMFVHVMLQLIGQMELKNK